MTHGLTKGTEYYGLNEVFLNYFSSLFKKTNKQQTITNNKKRKNRKPVDYVSFCSSPGLPSAGQLAALGQAGPMSQVCKQLCWAGPWLRSAVSQFKAQLGVGVGGI